MKKSGGQYEIPALIFIGVSLGLILIREILKINYLDLLMEIILGFGVCLGIILVRWVDARLNGNEKPPMA